MASSTLWSLVIYSGFVLVVLAVMLGVPRLVGQRHRDRATADPYEAGMVPTGSARLRISAKFYLVAMLFVIFDLEAAFLIAWAVSVRETGWTGYLGMLLFVAVLVVGLIYEWKSGALDWNRPRQRE